MIVKIANRYFTFFPTKSTFYSQSPSCFGLATADVRNHPCGCGCGAGQHSSKVSRALSSSNSTRGHSKIHPLSPRLRALKKHAACKAIFHKPLVGILQELEGFKDNTSCRKPCFPQASPRSTHILGNPRELPFPNLDLLSLCHASLPPPSYSNPSASCPDPAHPSRR